MSIGGIIATQNVTFLRTPQFSLVSSISSPRVSVTGGSHLVLRYCALFFYHSARDSCAPLTAGSAGGRNGAGLFALPHQVTRKENDPATARLRGRHVFVHGGGLKYLSERLKNRLKICSSERVHVFRTVVGLYVAQ